MALVTFQVIDGLERGRTFTFPTPITIGREDENTIRLNDERVSRFHAKVQEDGGRVILTDLESTNGTRVNGHPVQMRVLQFGDQVSVGRSLLVFGSPEELSEHAARHIDAQGEANARTQQVTGHNIPEEDLEAGEIEELFPNGPPEVPEGLRPVQAAQISDMLSFLHHQIAIVIDAAAEEQSDGFAPMRVDWLTWQRLLRVEMSLAAYLRKIAEPEG
jgi:hypothetical protein